ncbi:unnamed protein product [Amaranthus hypochondriacus]
MDCPITLKFLYNGIDVDIVVDYIDKVMLIDLINDYWEFFELNSIPTPRYPRFEYLWKIREYELRTDNDLVVMFDRLQGRTVIRIWVDDGEAETLYCISCIFVKSW